MNELSLLKSLLNHYSPTGQEKEAVEFLVAQMQTLGYQTLIDPAGNAIGSLGDGTGEIILLGHIDTVPGFINVHIEEDKLWGRGAVDAKGPLACFTAAAARLGPQPGWRITVIGAVGEEGDSRGAKYIRDHYPSIPKMAVIGEPSNWDRITLGYKGSAWFRYSVQRGMAHTAAQDESACEAAVAFWNRVSAWAHHFNTGREKAFEQVSPTLRKMNSSSDGFNESAELTIGMRLPPELNVEAAREAVQSLAENADIAQDDGIPAYRADKNNALVRAFLTAIRSHGGTPRFALKTGTADMNLVGPVWNCPIIAYGPGDSNLDHKPDEHILISEYQAAIQVLTSALQKLTSAPPPQNESNFL